MNFMENVTFELEPLKHTVGGRSLESSKSLAAEEPLTVIIVDAIKGDADSDWQYVSKAENGHRYDTVASCKGKNLFIAVSFINYPQVNTVKFYNNGVLINSKMTIFDSEQTLYDQKGKFVGLREYYGIPAEAIAPNSTLRIEIECLFGPPNGYAVLNNLQLNP